MRRGPAPTSRGPSRRGCGRSGPRARDSTEARPRRPLPGLALAAVPGTPAAARGTRSTGGTPAAARPLALRREPDVAALAGLVLQHAAAAAEVERGDDAPLDGRGLRLVARDALGDGVPPLHDGRGPRAVRVLRRDHLLADELLAL